MLNNGQLCGFGSSELSLRAVSLNTYSGVTSFTAPADIVAGDVLLIINIAWAYTTANYPTGFTLIDQQQNTLSATGRVISSYKIAAGTEGGTTISTTMAGTSPIIWLLVLRPSSPIKTVTPSTFTWQRTDADPANVTITTTGDPNVVFACVRDATSAHATGIFTPAEDYKTTSGTTRTYYKIFNSNLQSVVLAMGDMGTDNILYGFSCTVL